VATPNTQDNVTPENTRKDPEIKKTRDANPPRPPGDGSCDADPIDALNDRHRFAIELLVRGKSPGSVAHAVQVNPKTLYVWRQREVFRDELARRRRELWSEVGDRVRGLIHPSLDVIEQHLADRYDRARLRAAATVLRIANLRKTLDQCEPEDEFDEPC
jgi:hypothetical protein